MTRHILGDALRAMAATHQAMGYPGADTLRRVAAEQDDLDDNRFNDGGAPVTPEFREYVDRCPACGKPFPRANAPHDIRDRMAAAGLPQDIDASREDCSGVTRGTCPMRTRECG